ncbi:hypothetical protein SESBI_29885 [Sesbania bispinosa]|nr:hypothetical protein SESBI_29885 [Sesbania bispinosa]
MVRAARVSPSASEAVLDGDELSEQEKDLLDRSKKKPKVVGSGRLNDGGPLVTEKVAVQQTHVPKNVIGGAHVQASTGLVFERKTISYKDICLGVNGHNLSEKDVVFFEEANQYKEDGSTGGNKESSGGSMGDPLCPEVRLTDGEREAIRIPWKRSIIVKLLGRRMSLRYFQTRLYKLWRPKARMEVIDLDNGYFVIRQETTGVITRIDDNTPRNVEILNQKVIDKAMRTSNESDTHVVEIYNDGMDSVEFSSHTLSLNPLALDGPGKTKRKMGLNLRSQVRFKNIKGAARKIGSIPTLSIPLMKESIPLVFDEFNKGTDLGGPKDEVEIFNSRPPDINHLMVVEETFVSSDNFATLVTGHESLDGGNSATLVTGHESLDGGNSQDGV